MERSESQLVFTVNCCSITQNNGSQLGINLQSSVASAYLPEGEPVVDQERQHKTRQDQEIVSECVVVLVIRQAYCFVVSHVPHDGE